jgi:hypothetical protein
MAGHTNITPPAVRTQYGMTELSVMDKAIRSGRRADVWARIRKYNRQTAEHNRQTRIAKAERARIDARARKPDSGPTLDRARALAARFNTSADLTDKYLPNTGAAWARIAKTAKTAKDARGRKPTDKEVLRGADWLRKWDATILMASGRYIR